ncbi:GntR family transcriptional regulator [Clostridium sp.]|uniref:GntR family transcriptional regulator n=1 Tax=Clostridium sp. TaxID=1506 RepID=UPI001B5462F1|nr:GntR family transcriptional regulator [Clostridium sp.]MBP3917514.1 GntR family transcriptional regulator [Clostridium sp.]
MTLNINKFEFNNKEPIYLQIVELVKKNIATGDLVPGDKLPSVREMSKDLGVNPNTLQRSYGELERLGITYTRRGMGSFISEGDNSMKDLKINMGKDLAKKFISDMASIGIDKEESIKILKSLEE